MHYVLLLVSCHLLNYYFMIIFYINYFPLLYFNCIPIAIIDIIALPLYVALHVTLHVALLLQPYWLSLLIAGPSQCPLVDKQHPATVPRTRLAVTWRSWKETAQAVQNGSSVSNWNYLQFSQDTYNGDDVENWFPVVKFV
jgi:hypothetical protein